MRISLLAAIGATAVALFAPPAAAGPVVAGGALGSVTTLPLAPPQPGSALRREAPGGPGESREIRARATAAFALVGVSWDDPRVTLAGSVEVRTRSAVTGEWSDWYRLSADAEDGPDPAERSSRGATVPLWVGPSDGIAVRATAPDRPLPAGLRAELVDPGTASGAGPGRPGERAESGAGHAAPRPGIVTRSGWGADESLRDPDFQYTGAVRAVFVHHTDTSNDYSCADSAKVIRAIYQYHVKSNGWRDIGYNFLVDKCGTIYEGRAGGVDQPVLGAHTLGFNSNSSGVAALGSYGSAAVPQAQLDGISKIAAWKLGLTGVDAKGTTTLVSASDSSRYPKGRTVTFNTISGHRDAFATECPGDVLYGHLPGVRSTAAGLQGR
ncbi:N-acetylmuramoyl-L-alanine amidase [Kitasatospora sp. GP82]|uniref:N-acetylmuramoyl-L-alanine amidase n=1 Tax=Kitasatospora sp. GP82 TaxID=3035089 RepID=UPI0024772157|nr:N-acetylmuramoyl-L-alanine amidase [Kitasatospora sp. GP82]